MNQVKQAIIMAAGIGKRMQPITLHTPKPLVRINGIRIIDTIIQGLHENGIFDIYIVIGYLKEQFQCLADEYQGIHFIENPYYDTCNNISSLYVAREHLENAIILDGDQIIYNKNVLTPLFERSGYNAVWTDAHTEEWLMTTENGIVTHCSRTGGSKGWQLFSISRWNEADGHRLKKHLEAEFMEKRNRQIYWDDIAMFCYPEQYQLSICEMKQNDVLEIDSLEELMELDKSYQKYTMEKKNER